jgi:hypothetical protein
MTVCVTVDIKTATPESLVNQYCDQLQTINANSLLLLVRYPYEQYWLNDKPLVVLSALYCLRKASLGVEISFLVSDVVDLTAELELAPSSPEEALKYLGHKLCLPIVVSDQALPLVSLDIPKPWGQEIWFTGIENRGVAGVGNSECQSLLPYVLSALPQRLCAGRQHSLILLKVLDPLPQEVFGDLYFELHQQKREVYVVTHIDEQAWPSGEGAIRYGFNQQKRHQFGSDADFRHAFSLSVKRYEDKRRQIDALIDDWRLADGYELNEPVAAEVLESWMERVPAELTDKELHFRKEMNTFTDQLPLKLGDVVKVPCLTPHSLQHGVRTVEFQTPVYERLILSFAQKVLTQPEWDTAEAVQLMTLDAQPQEAHQSIVGSSEMRIERIVDFEDFEVQRVRLAVGAKLTLQQPQLYGLLMSIENGLKVGDHLLGAEQAVLLPNTLQSLDLINTSTNSLTFLLAYPK